MNKTNSTTSPKLSQSESLYQLEMIEELERLRARIELERWILIDENKRMREEMLNRNVNLRVMVMKKGA